MIGWFSLVRDMVEVECARKSDIQLLGLAVSTVEERQVCASYFAS
jgi:hypothetical protein